MLAAECAQRQEAVAAVVSVEESTALEPVLRVVGRVEVEHQLPARAPVRGDELLHELLLNRNRPLPLGSVLRPVKRPDDEGAEPSGLAPDSRHIEKYRHWP